VFSIRPLLSWFASTSLKINDTPAGSSSTKDVVVKAQVLSSGRIHGRFKNGLQGGVHMVDRADQVHELASQMLGQELVTKHAPEGILCHKILLMERISMRREMYLSIFMDHSSQGPLIVASPRGGSSIDEIAATNPEVIFTQPVDISEGIQVDQCHRIASNIGIEEGSIAHDQAVRLLQNMYALFIACDCTLIEINPLVETLEGNIVACDAKMNFDDNAEYRQASIFARRDPTQQDPREVEAGKHGLHYVGLADGTIGCMVNGAGLAMSTMDIIQLKGGSPANFLDVGGDADESHYQKAFEILNDDPRVNTILINIFGGLTRCDIVAHGIINAAKKIGVSKPTVIRLEGTNVDEARHLIDASGFHMILAHNLDYAAEKAIGIAKISSLHKQRRSKWA
jgi:succinyl-CoA synthetase beta subunit